MVVYSARRHPGPRHCRVIPSRLLGCAALTLCVVVFLYNSWSFDGFFNGSSRRSAKAAQKSLMESVEYRLKSLSIQGNEISKDLSNMRKFVHSLQMNKSDCLTEREGQMHNAQPAVAGQSNPKASDVAIAVNPNEGDKGAALMDSEPDVQFVRDYVVGLEHVKSAKDIDPVYKSSKGRKGVSVVVGIPTVKREAHSYIIDTLTSLFNNMNLKEKEDTLFVVFIAETEPKLVQQVADEIHQKFKDEMESGLLEIISPPSGFYVDFSKVVSTFGDSPQRMKWRTKQVLDYAYMMFYCRSRGQFYLQVEDDVIALPSYMTHIHNRALQDNDWTVLEFSSLGFIGKLFRTRDLTAFIHFFLMYHQNKPVDWLLDDFFYVKVCSPEKDMKTCRQEKQKHRVQYKPSLFQHMGRFSSLPGKIQKLQDKMFKPGLLPALNINPPAVVTTSLKTFQQYTLDKAYQQQDFFWGMKQSVNDSVEFHLTNPTKIKRIHIVSGNSDHPGDKFDESTHVEILTLDEHNRAEAEAKKTGQAVKPNYRDLCRPSSSGVVDCRPTEYGELKSVRIRFTKERETWVIFSAILLDV